MIGNVIQARYLRVTDYPTASALSFILMAAILIGVFLYVRLLGTRGARLMAAAVATGRQREVSLGTRVHRGRRPLAAADLRPRRDRCTWSCRSLVMIAFSFNDPAGRSNLQWGSFSIDAWLDPLGRPGLPEAVRNSLVIAVIVDDRRDHPRDAHRARPRALRLPRSRRRPTC